MAAISLHFSGENLSDFHVLNTQIPQVDCGQSSAQKGSIKQKQNFQTNVRATTCFDDHTQITAEAVTYTGLFISLSGISELDCATTKTDKAERSISIGRESLQVFFD